MSSQPPPESLQFGVIHPVFFLGLADHFQLGAQPFPVGGIDLFQLAHHKVHIVYPGIIKGNAWIFLIHTPFLLSDEGRSLTIRIAHESGDELGTSRIDRFEQVEAASVGANRVVNSPARVEQDFSVLVGPSEFTILPIVFDGFANAPGRYDVTASHGSTTYKVGSVEFHYRPAPPLTLDQITAIQADPAAIKLAILEFGCKYCSTKLRSYAGITRDAKIEANGTAWYSDLPNEFNCSCGKTRFSLQYVRESSHGLLLKDATLERSGLSYVRQYAHRNILTIIDRFRKLLDTVRLELPVQDFLKDNPILLAHFHARRLFVKPTILGKFQADFAIVDTNNELWFIEIERPNLPLFKRDGHPTAKLMHAYEQVNDWMHQYSKHSGAILESLKLEPKNVVAVRGAVIAGRNTSIKYEALQRHRMSAPYRNIEFMTFDDLANSLVNLSRKLA